MSAWRRRAIAAVPDMRETIEKAWSPMALWIELLSRFEKAVRADDMALARRIMDLARADLASTNADVRTGAALGFIEHLADPSVRDRMPELISAKEARDWHALIAYHAGDKAAWALEEACRDFARLRKHP